ncbi:MAG: TetR/AcrR family transcriptional regulator [Myxococcota bacterium]
MADHPNESRTARAAQAERTAFTERAILDAAEVVFARRGLAGTRVREIAQAAGMNGATLYNYYPSKSALYEAVLERGMKPLIAQLERYAAGPHELESTRALIAEVMRHLAEHPNLSRLVYLEAMAEGDHLTSLARKWFRPLMVRIVGELKGGAMPAALEERLLPLVAALFIHVSFGHFALAPLVREVFDVDPLSDAGVERQIRFIDALILQMFPQIAREGDEDDEEDVAE